MINKLLIQVRNGNFWHRRNDNPLTDRNISDFEVSIDSNFVIVEKDGSQSWKYDIVDVSIQIETSGTIETFTDRNVLIARLQAISYTPYLVFQRFTQNQILAIQGSNNPSGSNVFATMNDVGNSGGTSLYLGQFLSQADLETAHPTGINGNFAWIYDPANSIDRRAIWNRSAWFYDLDFKKDASDILKDVYYGSGEFFSNSSGGFAVVETEKGSTSVLQSILQYALGALIVNYWLNPANNFSNNWILTKKNKEKTLTDNENTTVLIPDIDQSVGKTYNAKELSLVVTPDYDTFNDFPTTGIAGIIYLALDTQLQYVWQFDNYQLIGTIAQNIGNITIIDPTNSQFANLVQAKQYVTDRIVQPDPNNLIVITNDTYSNGVYRFDLPRGTILTEILDLQCIDNLGFIAGFKNESFNGNTHNNHFLDVTANEPFLNEATGNNNFRDVILTSLDTRSFSSYSGQIKIRNLTSELDVFNAASGIVKINNLDVKGVANFKSFTGVVYIYGKINTNGNSGFFTTGQNATLHVNRNMTSNPDVLMAQNNGANVIFDL